jgi:hypothetical protein
MRRSYRYPKKNTLPAELVEKNTEVSVSLWPGPESNGVLLPNYWEGNTCNRCVTIHHRVFLLFYCPTLSTCSESKTPRLQCWNRYLAAPELGDQQMEQISSSILQPYGPKHTPECPRVGAKTFRKLIMAWPRFEQGCPADSV